MSFLRKRNNPINRHFFQKFQQQVSQAPGFKPLLSYEDFLKIIEMNTKAQAQDTNTQVNTQTVND